MNEVRLIDANALKREFIKDFYNAIGNGESAFDVIGAMKKAIDNAPTVEAYTEEDMCNATSNGYDIGYDFAKKHYEFDTEDFKKFVESRIDMQDLYLPTHFFDLLDEYCRVKNKGGTE